jgi:hypothetical protein
MQTKKKRSDFLESEEAIDARKKLEQMASSSLYNTASSFTTNGIEYTDNLMPFCDKHMNYLNNHPSLDVSTYLANLRLMTRIR